MDDKAKFLVEKYLEQVKVLTALSTTLLLTPNILLNIMEKESIRTRLSASLPDWKVYLVGTNIVLLIAILLTYFIYSSVIGSVNSGSYDIFRPATRAFSITQFICLIFGGAGLLLLFAHSM
jgi:hypothetical protein